MLMVQLRTGPNASAYCSSKFAVRALNQGAALEFGKHKITANVFCPTVVETDMWADMDRTIADLKGWKEGEYTRQVSTGVPHFLMLVSGPRSIPWAAMRQWMILQDLSRECIMPCEGSCESASSWGQILPTSQAKLYR